jgi:hypothetical protein
LIPNFIVRRAIGGDRRTRVDAAVAQKRPVAPNVLEGFQVNIAGQNFFWPNKFWSMSVIGIFQQPERSLRIAFVPIIIVLVAVMFLLVLVFVVWFLSKQGVSGY